MHQCAAADGLGGRILYAVDTYTAVFVENANVTIEYKVFNDVGGSVDRSSETIAPATGVVSGSTATPDDGYTFVS